MKIFDNSLNGPIGVDLDNTIISYDNVLFDVALEFNFIKSSNFKSKKAIRDSVRKLPEGDIKWQKLQAEIYGPRMSAAKLIDGVSDFFLQCRKESIPVYIVSHKTEFASYDSTGTNLRKAALKWLEENSFFNQEGMGLKRSDIYFESTRQDKIARIRSLSCKYFIDDLEETFLEETFPEGTSKILFGQHNEYESYDNVSVCKDWNTIKELIFGSNE